MLPGAPSVCLAHSATVTTVYFDRTPEEFTAYVKRLESLAWKLVGHRDEYEVLMDDPAMSQLTYVEALERLVLLKSGGID